MKRPDFTYLAITMGGLLFTQFATAQGSLTLQDSIAAYFQEAKDAAESHESLWGLNVYGPVLLVNPVTRQVYANQADGAGVLRADGLIFSGTLPSQVVLANASIGWNGNRWAMVLLPFLSKTSKEDRIQLLTHELFHRSQTALHFTLRERSNNHLDQKDGRIALRLEMEALKKAIQTDEVNEMKVHLRNAFVFRKYRYMVYPGSDTTENLSELNEGLAEYSGLIMSGRSHQEVANRLVQKIDDLATGGSFVRTFAYRTVPVYGYLLRTHNNTWNKQITSETNLTDYFIKQFSLVLPVDVTKAFQEIGQAYKLKTIESEETQRDAAKKQLISQYKDKFITQPHFEIVFEKKSTSFDSRNLTPLEGYGTVYPTITVSDNWGLLTVRNVGGLMSLNRDKITVTAPLTMEGNRIGGEGWTLELNSNYQVQKDKTTGNYTLINYKQHD